MGDKNVIPWLKICYPCLFPISVKTTAKIMHHIVLPEILISSDLFIGFLGHYAGSTKNAFTWTSFIDYLHRVTIWYLLPIFIIVLLVVLTVEIIIWQHLK